MKKALVVLLCIVLALSIVGCGISTTPEQEEAFKNWVDTISEETHILATTTFSDIYTDYTVYSTLIKALYKKTEKIIGIPESIVKSYDDIFTYEGSETNPTYKTSINTKTSLVEINISMLADKISGVEFNMTARGEESYKTIFAIDDLVKEFGEPSVMTFNNTAYNLVGGKESNLVEIKEGFEKKTEANCTLKWEVIRETDTKYLYSFNQIKTAGGSIIRSFYIV